MATMESPERIEKAAQLDVLGRDLTYFAYTRALSPVYRRQDLIEKVRAILLIKQNPILVGKPGTGKNAIVEGLVCEFVEQDYREYKKRYEYSVENGTYSRGVPAIYEVNPPAFEVDCYYTGNFETKINKVVENCKADNAILFIDNTHLAINAGATTRDQYGTLANQLLSYIEKGALSVIGATTPEGYEFMLNENPAFTNKFVKIEVPETTIEETRTILLRLKSHFESLYALKIEPVFITRLIDTADYLFPWRSFPGKAFEVLKEIIAIEKTKNNSHLTPGEVDKFIVEKMGLKDFLVLPERKIKKETIKQFFTQRLFEQDSAVELVCDIIMTFKAGLNSPNRPIAVLLFLGPSGVGKTELAKLIAEYLFGSQKKLLRFDMSEYISQEGQEKLIGSRSRNEPGILISRALANPFAVYLFDEIEKSNLFIFDILLQIFGEGRITDPKGRTVYLNNSIIIMTSNIGADLYTKIPPGFTTDITDNIRNIEKEIDRKLKEHFRPEFINRISKIVYFKPLSKDGIRKIAHKELNKLTQLRGLKAGSYKIEIAEDVMELLIKVGYTPEYGARPMQRAIEEFIVHPIAEKFASEDIPPTATLNVKMGDGGRPIVEVE